MAELKCSDGTVIKISDETEAELRKAFEPNVIEKYCKNHDIWKGYSASIQEVNGIKYVCVSLPHTNNGWVFKAYEWVMEFYNHFQNDYRLWVTYKNHLAKENTQCIWISFKRK